MLASIVYTRNNIKIILTTKEYIDMIYDMNNHYIVFNSITKDNIVCSLYCDCNVYNNTGSASSYGGGMIFFI